ncbi:hypothetical protein MRB53_028481 [Persea americana]|uniref:Uncharacterized protein n=1 Tax=Persea americana TaxID=3435 RepID=A0ACC2KG40_PERAE|nr:hypothetical protein MRB53_028481 [Persea americana]
MRTSSQNKPCSCQDGDKWGGLLIGRLDCTGYCEIKIICTNEKGDDVGDQWREEPWNYLLAQVVEMFKILSKFYTKTQAVLKRSRDRQDRKVNEGEGTRIVIGATDIGIAIGRNTEG